MLGDIDTFILVSRVSIRMQRWDRSAGQGAIEAAHDMRTGNGLMWDFDYSQDDPVMQFAKSWRELVKLQTAEMEQCP